MALGYLFAVVAAPASGSGSILESVGIRRAGVHGGTSPELVTLRRQPVYFLGLGVDLLGFVCAAAALHRLPLFLVQSLLAFSVGVTATLAAFLGTRLAPAGWIALGVGAAGLILLGMAADLGPARPGPCHPAGGGFCWAWPFPWPRSPSTPSGATASGRPRRWHSAPAWGFCVVGISARTLTIPDSAWRLILQPSVWAIVLNGLTAAAVVFAMALQKGRPTAVTAIMFTTNTALASLVGLAYLDDRVRAGFAVGCQLEGTTSEPVLP